MHTVAVAVDTAVCVAVLVLPAGVALTSGTVVLVDVDGTAVCVAVLLAGMVLSGVKVAVGEAVWVATEVEVAMDVDVDVDVDVDTGVEVG